MDTENDDGTLDFLINLFCAQVSGLVLGNRKGASCSHSHQRKMKSALEWEAHLYRCLEESAKAKGQLAEKFAEEEAKEQPTGKRRASETLLGPEKAGPRSRIDVGQFGE